jgi:hypothetical protein
VAGFFVADCLSQRKSGLMSAPRRPASRADEPIFDVGEPDIVRPLIATDRDGVAALVIRAINQDTAIA